MIVNEQTKHPVPADQVTLQNVIRRAVDALQSAGGGSPLADQYAGLVDAKSIITKHLDTLRKGIIQDYGDQALDEHLQAEPGTDVTFQFKGIYYVVDLDVYQPNRINWKSVASTWSDDPRYPVIVEQNRDTRPAVRINTGTIVR
jgi:hypothetical protein|tara:strand:+ start:215 stop:646 length:432 start_codon:yes stop_codon:yes gene_type:complete